ncbi:DUF4199 domain-containing protein [Aequorivita sp. H23M31]|uniref:DUF4199 domain-containing protein n=1 Tax=Aequorivita ciconiae TaxID=2494375 RepID=A0A410G733_9FLAO|nr:DUF4199 domain-containing protein [Aequorivita sp. H23M31]QAA83031.1 DUF4199 domain-containing protein [Aequorivita sp. H23M31]
MKKIYIEIKWAVIFSIALLCWILLEKTMGWQDESIQNFWWLTLLFTPFAILFYLLALREKRRRVYDRKMTWSQGFISGLIISVFVALLSPITQYIAYNFFTPEIFNTVAESSVTNDLMERSKMNDVLHINNYRWQSAFGLFGFGIVISVIAAFFVRKK